MATSYEGPQKVEGATCAWYVAPELSACGMPAEHTVRVRTRLVDVTVPLCSIHLAQHNENFARARVGQKGRRNG
jgi:hypothetical protein